MESPLDLPPELKALLEKRESADRRARDRRSDHLDENHDAQGADSSTQGQAPKIDRRRATRRKKSRRDDD